MDNITIAGIFSAGILSFFSPCVLPMLPVFSLMLSESVDGQEQKSWHIYMNSICFLCGFTFVFLVMGATASFVGQWFLNYQDFLRQISAVIIFIMGLSLTGALSTSILGQEFRPFRGHKLRGPMGSFLLGLAFTISWTPCTGPILATILVYAGTSSTVKIGILFLLIYSLGFSIPFFLIGVVFRKYLPSMRRFYKWLPIIQKGAGYLLIILSISIWMNWFQKGLGLLFSL